MGLKEMLNQNEVRFVWAFEVALGSLFLQDTAASHDGYYNAVSGKKYTIGEKVFFPLNARNTMLWAQTASTRCNAIQGHIPRRLQSFKSYRATYTDIGNLGLAPAVSSEEASRFSKSTCWRWTFSRGPRHASENFGSHFYRWSRS